MSAAYDGIVAELPLGRAGMVNHENRLLSAFYDAYQRTSPAALLTVEGATFEDGHCRKEAGALTYSTIIKSGSRWDAVYLGDFRYAAKLLQFTNNPAFVKAGGDARGSGASSANLTVAVPAGGHAIGNVLVVIAAGYSASAPYNPTTAPMACTDARGNTYTAIDFTTWPGTVPVYGRIFVTTITTALLAGDLITINYNSGATTFTERTVISAEFSGINSLTPITNVESNNNSAAAHPSSWSFSTPPSPPLPSAPILSLACLISDGKSNVTLTDGSEPTNFTLAKRITSSGSVTDLAMFYRIDNPANPTLGPIYDWNSTTTAVSQGSCSTTAGSASVLGSGTTFTNLSPGDLLTIGNETHVIQTITDNTHLTTTDTWLLTNTSVTGYAQIGHRLVAAAGDGYVYKDRGAGVFASTLASRLTKALLPGRFVAGGKEAAALPRKLFYYSQADLPWTISGDSAPGATLANPPSDWSTQTPPINGVIHLDRHVGFGNQNDPHRLYFSDPTDHENFVSPLATSLRVRSDIGDRIWCAVSFNGVLFVWKNPRGIFYLDDSDIVATNWQIRTKSNAIGCAPSPYAVLPIDDDILFLTATGSFHMLSAVDTLGGVRTSDLGYALGLSKWLRENLNLARLSATLSVWYPNKKVALFAVPGVGSQVCNLLLKFDLSGVERGEPVKFSFSKRDTIRGLALQQFSDGIERPIIAEGNVVKQLEQDTRSKDGAAYTWEIQTPHYDMAHLDPKLRSKRKLWDFLELIFEPVGSGTITAVVYVDNVAKQTLTFDATKRQQRKNLTVGDGHTISVKLTNNVAADDVKLDAILISFKPGNEDGSR